MRYIFSLFFLVFSCLFCPVNAQVVINEFVASNTEGLTDEEGEYSDWIEIYNPSASAVELGNYFLTDDLLQPQRWAMPQISLGPGSHMVIHASGKDRRNLPLTWQTIIDWGDEWKYIVPVADSGLAWHSTGYNDDSWNTGKSGFGYADDDDSTLLEGISSVFIRKEFTVADIASVATAVLHMDYDDGFIAYLNGVEIARMNVGSGEVPFDYLTGINHEALLWQGQEPEAFIIDNPQSILVEGNNVLAIQGHNISLTSSDFSLIPFLTLGRSGSGHIDSVSAHLSFNEGGLHTNFRIDIDGESLYIFNQSGSVIDSVSGVSLYLNVSYGRQPDGNAGWYFFGSPTPGEPNTGTALPQLVVDTVQFSMSGGQYSGTVNLSLSSVSGTSDIYYTLDGSLPNADDNLFVAPFQITNTTVVRARAITPEGIKGPIMTNTYILDRSHKFPVVCLSTEPSNLWDEETGIYAYGPNPGDYPYQSANFWQDWERPVHFELYNDEGIKVIDQGAGTKIFGGWSRASDQKSMSLFARKDYGKGSFDYKVFQEKPITEFEALVIRNSGNDNMGLQFHDGFITGLTKGMDIDKQAFEPAVLYLNGEYWGILNLREKVNEHFIASNHQLDADSINLLENEAITIYGSNDSYLQILDYLNTNSSLEDDSRYQWMEEHIDIDNFIRYQLTQIYINNQDWPGNNIKYWNTVSAGSKFRWILYDTDFGFGIWDVNDYAINTLNFALATNGPSWPNPPWSTLMLRRLVTNMEFRHSFINQYCDRLNTNFLPEVVDHHLDSLREYYTGEIQQQFERWGGSYVAWLSRIGDRKEYAAERPAYARAHMRSKFGLGSEFTINVDVSDEAEGRVLVNTVYPYDYPFEGIYFEDVPIRLTAKPRVGYKFVRWEGDVNSTSPSITWDMASGGDFNAVFEEAGVTDISVVINEINYNSSPERDTEDWVELFNNGLTTVDLQGWLLSDTGPDSGFFFPADYQLAPGDYIIVSRDAEAFNTFYPQINPVAGDMPFGLSSQGDMLRLYDDAGNLMDAVDYFVYAPWPTDANGTGATIELKDPGLDNSRGENWEAYAGFGTPGGRNQGIIDNVNMPVAPSEMAMECFPNPFTDFTTLQFSIEEPGHFHISIVDLSGRTVTVLADEYLTPGIWYRDITAEDLGMQHGIFTIRMTGDNRIETYKLLKLK